MNGTPVIALIGAGAFGSLVGWYVYYINRYRKSDVQLGDITTLVGVLGGATATALFSPGGQLFGAYGIGLFAGFFGYFVSLIYLVDRSDNFDADWFLDGRRKRPEEPFYIPSETAPSVRPMVMREMGPAAQKPVLEPAPSREDESALRVPSGVAPLELTQSIIDACAAVNLSNSVDVQAQFASTGGFIPWYNDRLSSHKEFAHRGKIRNTSIVTKRFETFWDHIPHVFGKPHITMLEFCALMCIGIQENSGDLWANPERVGTADHPGLAYAFDRIPGKKQSYNHANGNWTAYKLFTDATYVSAHRSLSGADRVLRPPIDEAWAGEKWPAGFPTVEDESVNGFLMQADFYKFRGRGIIQTTGRSDYLPIISFVLNDPIARTNQDLDALAQVWVRRGADPSNSLDAIASRSTNDEWHIAFGEPLILAAGIRIDSEKKGRYLELSHEAQVLSAGVKTKGSLYFMARRINGGNYPDQVVPMMKAMLHAFGMENPLPGTLRTPRDSFMLEEVSDTDLRPYDIRPWEEVTKNPADDEAAQATNAQAPAEVRSSWRVARSLLILREQVNQAAPNRSKTNDGTIGDAAHQTRRSDHNPWVKDGNIGVVTAIDITHDPGQGCDAGALAESIRLSRDFRVKYIIWNRRIANHEPLDGAEAWVWRAYHGSNPHDHHVHISVKAEKTTYDNTQDWSVALSS